MATGPDSPERLDVGRHAERGMAAASVVQGLKETVLLVILGLAGCLGLALVTFSPDDPGPFFTGSGVEVINIVGLSGAWVAQTLVHLLGVTAYIVPIATLALAGMIYRFWHDNFPWLPTCWRLLGVLLILLSVAALGGMHFKNSILPVDFGTAMVGGIIGAHIASLMVSTTGVLGGTVLLLTTVMIGLSIGTGLSWLMVAERLGIATRFVSYQAYRVISAITIRVIKASVWSGRKIWMLMGIMGRTGFVVIATVLLLLTRVMFALVRYFILAIQALWRLIQAKFLPHRSPNVLYLQLFGARLSRRESMLGAATDRLLALKIMPSPEPLPPRAPTRAPTPKAAPEPKQQDDFADEEPEVSLQAELPLAAPPAAKPASKAKQAPSPDFTLPNIRLLAETTPKDTGVAVDERLEQQGKLLEQRLAEFGVEAKVTGIYPGPVITRFEIQPAAGVKAAKITGLAQDLARSLAVLRVRVVEVISGKTVVGIEIPNHNREIVQLSETLSSDVYQKSKSKLTLALGKDIAGVVACADLGSMPHLLVAGTTGSGKSVGINAMLLSILFKATPQQVRLIMVDPKMLELSIYEGIPHLLTPVITDMKQAANALSWCVYEMDRRYRLMSETGVRHLQSFNQKLEKDRAKGEPLLAPDWAGDDTPRELEALPLIVVVIDEFAEMMMLSGKKTEDLIVRIAQKARAAGIHLILGTQRPSVDVITGLIKANIPGRLSFQVATKIDSRTILDQGGAEQLLGHGDMLFLPPGTPTPIRIHGAFVEDEEVHRVVDALRLQAEPDYIDAVLHGQPPVASGESNASEEQDELYEEAVNFVIESKRASISSLQRKLRVGYNRAARLVETMEEAGIVSQMDGAGNREVLVTASP